ncbi:hypothetical protein HYN59_07285 [Flavobacterium album]|uniref:Uncharacterized protein n=1 Tax=Flavobacterium album TaxID=2175091 RepID=A0A2S1QX15_9FLAO|nr:DUF6549 family protein [Flavobacterium album]AWH84942.1 hypothetical protein HYN59_07285 [Flavobacterium album]
MKKYIPYIVIAILAVMLLVSFQECSHRGEMTDTNLKAIVDTVQHYKNRLGTQSSGIRTLQFDKAQLQKELIEKDSDLAALTKEFIKVRSIVKFQAVTQFDTIGIVYKDSVPCVFERSGKTFDKWYSFGYKADQAGVKIDSFKTWTSANIITGTKRKWFLGEQAIKTDITLSNPNMAVTNITAAEVIIPSPWYRKWYVWLAAGAIGGFVISK